ncbi:type II toxin-antitoxin system VapC family toxin [Meiothermus sp. QL-1]|uniref:type II toxin-antitoxin system VapC family toxin n=1 Tax=Meiothermus sp. QL-1 TaxID=2058095 RepID=UPI000E0CBBCC|nr:type II toxin-antitoxin system VapC family toxin [Meiothermus sp. QL-1]RDI94941.1 type II toxin-antitoxin system VapC family toxin [Meiothermus sp. QL-1]
MRFLLDTHTLLWYDTAKALLSARVLALVRNRSHEVYVSSITAWELAIKWKLGRLPSARNLLEEYHSSLQVYGFLELPFSSVHALQASRYDQEHKDPFDRALAAQAQVEQLTLLSKDEVFDRFGVSRLW